MTYEKDYIGKGKTNEKFSNIVKFSFKLEDLQRIAYEYEGEMYVTFETAAMKSPDKFGRTHVAWVRGEKKAEDQPMATPKKRNSRRAATAK